MATGSIELIQASSTARNDSVMARVIIATSLGLCVPTKSSRLEGEAVVFTDVLTDDTDASIWESSGALIDSPVGVFVLSCDV